MSFYMIRKKENKKKQKKEKKKNFFKEIVMKALTLDILSLEIKKPFYASNVSITYNSGCWTCNFAVIMIVNVLAYVG